MLLVVIRHGVAADRDAFAESGRPDDERPLTPKGRRQMRRNARGLCTVVTSLHVIATSPLTRAVETADIVADAYDDEPEPVTRDELRPNASFDALIAWLATRPLDDTVAIVGHEPHLSRLVGWLLTGTDRSVITLGKGGACLVAFDGAPTAGGGQLRWLFDAKQLRALD